MRRFFYGLIIFLVLIAIGAAPWANGYLFKQQYLALLAAINKEKKVNIRVQEYRQGWLNSYAKITVEPTRPDNNGHNNDFPLFITIEQNISHGPLVYDEINHKWTLALGAVYSRIRMPPVVEALFFRNATQNAIEIQTFANFRGDFFNQINIPALSLEVPNAGKLNWQGLQGTVFLRFNRHYYLSNVKSVINIGLLQAENNQSKLLIQSISTTQDIIRQPIGLWNGNYTISLPNMTINDPGFTLSLADFNLLATFGVEAKDFYNSSIEITIGNLATADFTIQPGALKISALNLNANELVKLGHSYFTIEDLQTLIPHLLTTKSLLHGNLDVTTSYGKLMVDALASWPTNTPPPVQLTDIENKSNSKINIRIAISLVNQLMTIAANKQTATYAAQLATQSSNNQPQTFDKFVSSLSDDNKISLDVAIRLNDLQKGNLAQDSFAKNIDDYVLRKEISPEIAQQLKTQYAELQHENKLAVTKQAQTPAPMSTSDYQQKTKQAMQQQINELIKNGYLMVDKTDYVVTLTREQGVTKINGKVTTPDQLVPLTH